MKSTPPELSNDGSHDAESKLCQKLLTIDGFPGTLLTGNIWETKNARAWKKYFFRRTFKGQLIDISFQGYF